MTALLRRPDLWLDAALLAARTFPWPKEWRHFRAQTYGVERLRDIPAADAIRYVEWCKAWRTVALPNASTAAPLDEG